MKRLIKPIIFISLSLLVHLLLYDFVNASKITKPHYAPMKVTLVQKKTPQKKIITQQPPPEKPKPKPLPKPLPKPIPEPPPEIIEEPPEPEEVAMIDPQPVEEPLAQPPEVIDHDLLVSGYHQRVFEIIRKNLYYPKSARRRGLEGTVDIRFVLDASGKVCDLRVEKTSGCSVLDKASMKTINRCIFPPPPDDTLTLNIPITFKLIEDS